MRPPVKHALVPLALLLAATTLRAQAEARPAPAGAPVEETSEFGKPLYVGDQHVTDLQIKRFICYARGRFALESEKFEALIEHELRVREAQGEDISQYEVSDEEYQWIYDREMGDFTERYPDLDPGVELERAYQTIGLYNVQLRQRLKFDKIFFPGDPAEWPDVTKELIHAASPEVDLVEDAKRAYDFRAEEAAKTGERIQPEDEMFQGLVRDYVVRGITGLLTIETADQQIPENLVLRVTGDNFSYEVETEPFYDSIEESVTDVDIERAKTFLALIAAAEQALAEAGVLHPWDEFMEHVSEVREETKDSIFPYDFLALYGHEFPSVESFNQHYRCMESYRDLIHDDLEGPDPEKLTEKVAAHVEKANEVMGLGKVNVDVMLCSAFDFERNEWIEGGWEKAREKAERLRTTIDEELAAHVAQEEARKAAVQRGENFTPTRELLPFARFWSDLLDLESDYWDPPMPAKGKMPPAQGFKNKGRFGMRTRNDLEKAIGENSFLRFISGDSITDRIFFDVDVDDVGGPWRGPEGYYLAYVKRRTPPTHPLNLSTERHREVVKEDYLRLHFDEFAHEKLLATEVRGL